MGEKKEAHVGCRGGKIREMRFDRLRDITALLISLGLPTATSNLPLHFTFYPTHAVCFKHYIFML